jgi:hypothetical protein
MNRRDKLVRRLRYPEKNLIEESFVRGRTSALKNLTEVLGKQRILEYFPASRLDGLQRTVEDIGFKISEYFVGRDDMLTYHSCKLDLTLTDKSLPTLNLNVDGLNMGEVPITKMTLKYERPAIKNQNNEFSKIVFYPDRIRLEKHAYDTSIAYETIVFHRNEGGLEPSS